MLMLTGTRFAFVRDYLKIEGGGFQRVEEYADAVLEYDGKAHFVVVKHRRLPVGEKLDMIDAVQFIVHALNDYRVLVGAAGTAYRDP